MNWVKHCSAMTIKKVEYLMTNTRLEPSGVVMRDPETGAMTIVEQGDVVRFTKEEAWKLMHPKQPNK